jgi:hypothetical protein
MPLDYFRQVALDGDRIRGINGRHFRQTTTPLDSRGHVFKGRTPARRQHDLRTFTRKRTRHSAAHRPRCSKNNRSSPC